MNKKTITEGMLALLFAMSAPSETHIMAQERNAETLKRPTLEDLIPGGETYRYTKNLYGLQWWGDVCIKPDMDDLKIIDLQSGKETVLVTRET